MKLVRRFAVPLVVVAVLVVTAVNCVGWLPINDRPCPCTHGWTCSVDTCVPDGYPPDGGTADAQFPSADAPFPSDGGGAPDVHPFPSDGGGAPDANPFPSDAGRR